MKNILMLILLCSVAVAVSGCGLASGIAKDFGGYGEQLSGKVKPKEYDSYDNNIKFGTPEKPASPVIQHVEVTNKSYKGGARENDIAVVIGNLYPDRVGLRRGVIHSQFGCILANFQIDKVIVAQGPGKVIVTLVNSRLSIPLR